MNATLFLPRIEHDVPGGTLFAFSPLTTIGTNPQFNITYGRGDFNRFYANFIWGPCSAIATQSPLQINCLAGAEYPIKLRLWHQPIEPTTFRWNITEIYNTQHIINTHTIYATITTPLLTPTPTPFPTISPIALTPITPITPNTIILLLSILCICCTTILCCRRRHTKHQHTTISTSVLLGVYMEPHPVCYIEQT